MPSIEYGPRFALRLIYEGDVNPLLPPVKAQVMSSPKRAYPVGTSSLGGGVGS